MILQALERCYGLMAKDARFHVAPPGYSAQDCSFALVIDADGAFVSVYDLREEKRRPTFIVPLQKYRSGKSLQPYFLCENSKYFLGGVYNKTKKCLDDCEAALAEAENLHRAALDGVDDAGARAVLRFFARRRLREAAPIEMTHDFYSAGFAVLRIEGEDGCLHERPALRRAWEAYLAAQGGAAGERGQCLITGEEQAPLARTHPFLKGVAGAKASGGSLVGFNFDALQSYGKSQSYNAPTSAGAAFRYATALNALIANDANRLLMGDVTCVIWTEREVCGDATAVIRQMFEGGEIDAPKEFKFSAKGAGDARFILLRAIYGRDTPDEILRDALDNTVYILGLAPSAARLSVRFWHKDSFAAFTRHAVEHLSDMEIAAEPGAKPFVSARDLLLSMAAFGKKDNIPKSMQRALFQAIVSGGPYPPGAYAQMLMRMRAEAGEEYCVNRTRAAYIKAYIKRNRRKNARKDEEELTMALNENSTSAAYQLGRLFSVLEQVQERAGNKNLRERYFGSASTNPKTVFPTMLKLTQNHLAKVMKEKKGQGIFFDKLCGEILDRIEEDKGFPASLELEEQGMFILGYYQQKQALYQSKKLKEIEAQPDSAEELAKADN